MTALWLLWLGLFVGLEGYALVSKREGDTLSEHVWRWFGIGEAGKPRPPVTASVRVRRFVLLAFVTWLAVHFMTGGFV